MINFKLADEARFVSYLRGNSFCSEQHRLFYVATPKVACTLLKWWFADLEGYSQLLREFQGSAETDPDLIIHDSFYKIAPNVTGLKPDALITPLTSDAYFKFAVVRNPYKRIFSAWQSKLLLREPLQVDPYLNCDFFKQPIESVTDIAAAFEGFLEHLAQHEAPDFLDFHWTPQAVLLRPDLIDYTQLVKIENAENLSTALAGWLGSRFVDPFFKQGMNESLIPYLSAFVTKRSAQLIHELYAEDFETFGYSASLPESSVVFTPDQFDVARRAIEMTRARHKRFGEMRNYLSKKIASHQALAKTTFSSAQLHRLENPQTSLETMLKEMVLSLARAGHDVAVANIHGKLDVLSQDDVSLVKKSRDSEVDLRYSIGLLHGGCLWGWVLDNSQPLRKFHIEILQSQKLIASGMANLFRRDLAEAEVGDGCCAFKLKVLSNPTLDGGDIALHVKELDKTFLVHPASVRGLA